MMRTCGLRQSGLFGIPSIHGVRALAPSIVDDCLREVRFCRTLMSASGIAVGFLPRDYLPRQSDKQIPR